MPTPAWETKVRDRLRKGLRKYAKIFGDAKLHKKSEADISGLVFVMLEDVFGYDKVNEISAEYKIRAQYADYCIKMGGKPVILIELKAPNVKLNQNHLLQVSTYAAQKGMEWVLLTNGLVWQLFHVAKTAPMAEDAVFEVDLGLGTSPETVDSLCSITREFVARGEPRKTYEKVLALQPKNLLRALYSDAVISEFRRALRASTGHKADVDELRDLVDRHLLKPELVGKVKPPRVRAKPKVKPEPKSRAETKEVVVKPEQLSVN